MSTDEAGSDNAPTLPSGGPAGTKETAVDLEPDLLAGMEGVCRRFQVALGEGRRPRIEDALGNGHPVLLRELLKRELAHRRGAGERPEPEEYRARFPDREAVIRDAFAVLTEPATDRADRTVAAPPGLAALAARPVPAMADMEILGELGGGGMAVVYRAFDRRRGQVVALKVLPHTSPSALYRFKQEFRSLADVTHPNLVTLYELISDGRQWSFTMELVDGVDLLAHVRGTRSGAESESGEAVPDPGRLRDAFRQLAEGVCALHQAGYVHRDLKPSNVLVARTGRVVILDLGIAAELDREGLHQSTEAHVIGTIPYMSPEQGAGLAVSPATDWYSVGVMLYEALAGQRPFVGSRIDILRDKQTREPPAPSTVVKGVPDDLDALCVDLLRREPSDRPSDQDMIVRLKGVPGAERPGPGLGREAGQGTPLIGRERHLEVLNAALQSMRRGRTVICSVYGRSGVGKSALIQRFLDDLPTDEDRGVVVLSGRCYEQESVPYKAFDSLVDALSRYLKRLPRWEVEALLPRDVQLLGRLFPVLRRVAAVGEAPHRSLGLETPDRHELRQRAFTALRELLARLGDRKSLILMIDDLQWADVDSAALLSDLLRPPDPPSLLLLACYRSEETDANPFLRAMREPTPSATADLVERRDLAVEALSPSQAGALARALLGRDDPAVQAISRESGGNPFFVAELVNFVQTGAGLAGGDRDDSSATRAIALDEVLWERVVRLPETARRLLEVVAVSGQPLSQTAASRAVALGAEERSALALLRAGRLIRSASQADRDVIETYHDRVRETVVAHLAPEVREDCHQRLAQALLDSGETDFETLAAHFRGANQPGRAGEYFALAADRAAETLAFDRAAKLYRLALDLRPAAGVAGGEEVRRLRTKLGDALANAARGAEAAREYLAAREGANVAETLELERRAALQFLVSGYFDEGIAVLRTVLHAVGMSLPGSPRSAFRSLLLARLLIRLRGLGFRERDISQVSPADLTRIDICWAGVAGLSLVDPIPAAVFQTRNLLLSLRAGEPYRVARALAMHAFHAAATGRRSRARTLKILQAADELAQRVGHPHALGMVALATGVAAYCVGRWREAHEASEQAAEIFRGRCNGVAWELTTARLISLPSLIWMGEHAEAFRRLNTYRKEAEERGELYCLASVGAFGVHECLASDEPERARADLSAIMGVWSRQGFHMQHMEGLWVESHIDLYCEDGDAAWDRMTRQWPVLERSLLMRVQVIRIGLRHLRARCALAKASAVGAERAAPYLDAAQREARLMRRERMPWGDALADLIVAGVASGRGDAAVASASLAAALAGLDAHDMRYPAAVTRRRLGELIGGDEGRALIAQVNAWMSAQQIRNPDRFCAMLAPGFPAGP